MYQASFDFCRWTGTFSPSSWNRLQPQIDPVQNWTIISTCPRIIRSKIVFFIESVTFQLHARMLSPQPTQSLKSLNGHFSGLGFEIIFNDLGQALAFNNHDNCCFSWLSCISSLSISLSSLLWQKKIASPNYSPVLSAVEDVNRVRCDYNAHQLLDLYPFMLGHQ